MGKRGRKPMPAEKRLWHKVNKSGDCWVWEGSSHTKGYGFIQSRVGEEKRLYVHRISYELHYGPIPDKLFVLHKCDNKLCVNPDHLELGTQHKNIKDARKRGLFKPWKNKLTENEVMKIKSSKESLSTLSNKYGVSIGTIRYHRMKK